MVGEQREDIVVLGTENLLDETVQGLLRADLDEDPRAGLVEGVQALDELHRLGDLAAEDLEHRLGVRRDRVELAGHVGHDRQARPAHLEAAHRDLQGLAGPGDDLRVEGVRDRDAHRGDPGGLERGHGGLDGGWSHRR